MGKAAFSAQVPASPTSIQDRAKHKECALMPQTRSPGSRCADVSTSANRHRIGCVVRLRARARWQARWRPHPRMVCLGAVLFAVVSLRTALEALATRGGLTHRSSPGLAFWALCINQQGSVHSLTKAARLWFTEAIGLAVGVGMLLMSVMNEILVFLLLRFGPRSGWKSTKVSRSEFSRTQSLSRCGLARSRPMMFRVTFLVRIQGATNPEIRPLW